MHQPDLNSTTDRLRNALAKARLPSELVETVQRLLAGLERPAQITVLGFPGVGKTTFINSLLRAEQIPALTGVPIFEVTFGEVEQVTVEAADGTSCSREGMVRQSDVRPDTIRILQELPEPHLNGRKLAEVSFAAGPEMQAEVMKWVTLRTNIAVWCTQNFDAREAAIWAQVPERLKDNGFLVLTKADQLQMKGDLADRRQALEDQCAEEFFSIFPVAIKHALAACSKGTVADDNLWRASGFKPLTDAVDRLVSSGKMADMDHADMLLARIGPEEEDITCENEAEQALETAPEVEPADHAATGETFKMGRLETIETALNVLQGCAEDLQKNCRQRDNPTYVLEHCAEAAQALSTLLMDSRTDDPELNVLREDAVESEQMIQLFQLERNETAASDAVTVLLQLKKEISQVGMS